MKVTKDNGRFISSFNEADLSSLGITKLGMEIIVKLPNRKVQFQAVFDEYPYLHSKVGLSKLLSDDT